MHLSQIVNYICLDCKVYNISNSSASLHLCPLTWSALSWSLRSLSLSRPNQEIHPTPVRKGKPNKLEPCFQEIPFALMMRFHDIIKVLKSKSKKVHIVNIEASFILRFFLVFLLITSVLCAQWLGPFFQFCSFWSEWQRNLPIIGPPHDEKPQRPEKVQF